jgi:fatty-acyl-CoA synthase
MRTASERLRLHHERTPERVAIYLQRSGLPDLSISYRQLMSGSISYARSFERAGLRPGEVVVLILQHGEDLLYSFWGAILYGAVPTIMPYLTEKLSPEQYRSDLTALIKVTKPAAVVTYPEFESEVRGALRGGNSELSVLLTSGLLPQSEAALDVLSGTERRLDEIVVLQHSSGTTGLQKGVALSHRALLNQLDEYARILNLNEGDVIVSWLPLYHDMGLIAGFMLPVLTGVPLVLSSPFDWVRAPYRLLQSVSRYRGTLSWLPNFAYNFCAQKIRDRDLINVDLSSWRGVINCSEPVRAESHEAFLDRFGSYGLKPGAMQTCYAMAENVFAVTQSDLAGIPGVLEIDREIFTSEHHVVKAGGGAPSMKVMSCGKPIANTQVRILDAHHQGLTDKTEGEIAISSDCMLSGYYNRPEITRKAFFEGWYLTGDHGFISDGELYVSGRKKDVIIVGGRNLYPQDLEALTYEVPGVHAGRSVAFGLFDEQAGTEEVVIIAEVDSEDEAEQQRIADLVRGHVTKNSAIALRHIRVVGPKWILKTSSGKTARSANKEKFLKELQSRGNKNPPSQ